MAFLRWLKSRSGDWRADPGFVNLAISGIPPADALLFGKLDDYRDELADLLSTKYANEWGHEALIAVLRNRYHLGEGQGVLPVAGSSFAIWVVYDALLSAGDRVLVESPTYDPLFRVPQSRGIAVDGLQRKPESGYGIDLGDLWRAMTPKTKLVVLTDLHNPSGATLTRETLVAVAEVAKQVSPTVKILVDETFLDFASVPRAFAATIDPCFLSIGSLSKVYGLSLLRCGWVVASGETFEAVRESWLQAYNVGSRFTEALATLALRHAADYAEPWKLTLKTNREVVREEFASLRDFLECEIPADGCVCFPRLKVADPAGFVADLEARHRVAVAPGRFFGADDHFRLGFGGDSAKLAEGLRRIAFALRS